MTITKKMKRDSILIAVILLLLGSVFAYMEILYNPGDATVANVYYGSDQNPIVIIDFTKQEIFVQFEQPSSENYPVVDAINQTITLLGDFEVGGVRQEVIIGYNFDKKTVRVIEEQSPYNVCSKQGESDGAAIICLPNGIRVEFSTATTDFIL